MTGLPVEAYGCVPGEHRPLLPLWIPERWMVLLGRAGGSAGCQCGQVRFEAALPRTSPEGEK